MLSKSREYSKQEWRLINYYGVADIALSVFPPTLYSVVMVNKAFMQNDQSNYSRALRNCVVALSDGNICRMTPEFDDMISRELDGK